MPTDFYEETRSGAAPVQNDVPIGSHIWAESGCVPGPSCFFPAGGGRNNDNSGGRSIETLIDLSTIAYVTGGVCLDPKAVGLCTINMMDMLGATDPFCDKIVPCGVQLVLDCTDPCKPTLQIFNELGEVLPGWAKDGQVWVRFYGAG